VRGGKKQNGKLTVRGSKTCSSTCPNRETQEGDKLLNHLDKGFFVNQPPRAEGTPQTPQKQVPFRRNARVDLWTFLPFFLPSFLLSHSL